MNTKMIDDRKTRDYFGGGIYAIINKRNGKMYVGSSGNVSKRVKEHESSFRNMKCNNKIKESILNGDKFYSEILEKVQLPCTIEYLREKENEYVVKHKAVENGYNVMYLCHINHPNKIIMERNTNETSCRGKNIK